MLLEAQTARELQHSRPKRTPSPKYSVHIKMHTNRQGQQAGLWWEWLVGLGDVAASLQDPQTSTHGRALCAVLRIPPTCLLVQCSVHSRVEGRHDVVAKVAAQAATRLRRRLGSRRGWLHARCPLVARRLSGRRPLRRCLPRRCPPCLLLCRCRVPLRPCSLAPGCSARDFTRLRRQRRAVPHHHIPARTHGGTAE